MLTPPAPANRPLRAFGVIVVLTILVRLPFAFSAVIDWDESTFILIGQSILDGHLPYAHLWDLKPPLLFGFFAAVIGLFGHTIEGVRLAGSLCVAATAWFVHAIAARRWGRPAGWLGASLCVLMSSLIQSGQATMSEHVMLPAFMGALYLWLTRPVASWTPFVIGALMAAATLVRPNVAYAVIAFGALVATSARRQHRSVFRAVAGYGSGGVIVAALICLPFVIAGQWTLLWKSTVVAAAARVDISDWPGRVMSLVESAYRTSDASGPEHTLWLGIWCWTAAVAGLAFGLRRARLSGTTTDPELIALPALLIATIAGILTSGSGFGHYQIQLVPLASLAAAALASHPSRAIRRAIWITTILFAVSSAGPVARKYRDLAVRAAAGQRLRYGPAYELADELGRRNPQRLPIFLLTDHVVYWLLELEPPTGYATHPSTLSRDRVLAVMGTSTRVELEKIFDRAPEFVVLSPNEPILVGPDRESLYATLARDYLAPERIAGRDVYRRKSR